MEILTVGDFAKICRTDIKVLSGFNGEVLCNRFNPRTHTEISGREIISIWSEIRVSHIGHRNAAFSEICVYVDGALEVK